MQTRESFVSSVIFVVSYYTLLIQDRFDISVNWYSSLFSQKRRVGDAKCLTPSAWNWSGKSKAASGLPRLTLVLFEFYLTSRQALTNSIPLSGDASDVSGFARSFRKRCSIRRSWRHGEVYRSSPSPSDDPATSLSLPLALSLSLSLLTYPACPYTTPLHPFLPHKLRSILRGKLLRGASLFWFLYFTDSDYPPYLSRFYPFSSLSPIVPSPPFPSQYPTVFTLVTLVPSVFTPMRYA